MKKYSIVGVTVVTLLVTGLLFLLFTQPFRKVVELAIVVIFTLGFFVYWRSAIERRRSSIQMTTTPSIALANKPGLVELNGEAVAVNTAQLKDPVQHKACLWFKVETWERTGKGWREVKSASSERVFAMKDTTGVIAIRPFEARFELGDPERIRPSFGVEHRIWRICAGDPLFVTGQLSIGKPDLYSKKPDENDPEDAVPGAIRAVVGRGNKSVLDANRDGKIDINEMMSSHEHARKAAASVDGIPEMLGNAQFKRIHCPLNRTNFVISTLSEKKLTRRFTRTVIKRFFLFLFFLLMTIFYIYYALYLGHDMRRR